MKSPPSAAFSVRELEGDRVVFSAAASPVGRWGAFEHHAVLDFSDLRRLDAGRAVRP